MIFLILGYDKAELMRVRVEIEKELKRLKLKVNPKSAIYNCCTEAGFAFLGYRYYIDRKGGLRVVPLSGTVRRIRRRLKTLKMHNPKKYALSYESYKGYFMNAWPRLEMDGVVGEFRWYT